MEVIIWRSVFLMVIMQIDVFNPVGAPFHQLKLVLSLERSSAFPKSRADLNRRSDSA